MSYEIFDEIPVLLDLDDESVVLLAIDRHALGVALAERRERRAAQLLGARLEHLEVAQAVQAGGVDAVAAVPLELLRAAFHEARRHSRVRARDQLRDRRRARRRAAFGHCTAERRGAQVH